MKKTQNISINEGIIIENIEAKGEIARFEQFLLLSKCFQQSSGAEASESLYMWERVKGKVIDIVFITSRTSEDMISLYNGKHCGEKRKCLF